MTQITHPGLTGDETIDIHPSAPLRTLTRAKVMILHKEWET